MANRHPLARRAHLPPHSLSVFIPLVDLTPANGPTEFQLGTHVKANLVKPQRRCATAESGSEPGSEFEYLHFDLRGPATASESATPRSPQMRRRLRGGRPRHLRHACDAPWRTEWIRRGQARHHTVGPRVSLLAFTTCANKICHLGQADGVSHVQPRVVPRHPQPVTRVKFQAASTSERRARAPWTDPPAHRQHTVPRWPTTSSAAGPRNAQAPSQREVLQLANDEPSGYRVPSRVRRSAAAEKESAARSAPQSSSPQIPRRPSD